MFLAQPPWSKTGVYSLLPEGQKVNSGYSVCFTAQELWGGNAEPNQGVYLDLWEGYLEPV